MWPTLSLCAVLLEVSLVLGASHPPQVQLDRATVFGTTNASVDSFLGIPYAQPPLGDLRLRLPQLLTSYEGTINATAYGNQCLSQVLGIPTGLPSELQAGIVPFQALFAANPDVPHDEDCLYLNVIRPSNISHDAKLPVVVWIYGGGFSGGSNSVLSYNGAIIVERSIAIDHPIIWVAINYRVNAFGFLGGEEVKKAGIGNLGLHDQRTALRWVNQRISAFGGDPTKVTLWGQSSGAISVTLQMLANDGNTEGLFHAAMMNSGSLLPTGDITELQDAYDFITSQVGCSASSDTLACLRTVPADDIIAAVNKTPSELGYPGLANDYAPRADGNFVTMPPMQLIRQGKLANIPFVIGNDRDQGTLWSIGSLNITTDTEFQDYIAENWLPGATSDDLEMVLEYYSANPVLGSPYGTGDENAFTPEYKRMSALQGDLYFYAPGRILLDTYSSRQPAYYWQYDRGAVPGLGVSHGSELFDVYGPGDMTDYYVRFIATLDPNGQTGVYWPRFETTNRSTLQFNEGDVPLNITRDVERLEGTDALSALSLRFPF